MVIILVFAAGKGQFLQRVSILGDRIGCTGLKVGKRFSQSGAPSLVHSAVGANFERGTAKFYE